MVGSLSIVCATLAQQPASGASIGSVWDFVVKGGLVMIPIGICSLLAVAIAVERLIVLRRSRVIPGSFIEGLRGVLGAGGDVQARAVEYCRANPSPIARICEAGMRQWSRPIERAEKQIAEAGQREVLGMRKNLRGLAVLASVAPLLGLLGTITGMIRAFQTVATNAEALGRTELLARGIYEAMITTAAGLVVAIPTLLIFHFLSSRIERFVLEMDWACVELFERLGAGADSVAEPKRAAPTPSPTETVHGGVVAGAIA